MALVAEGAAGLAGAGGDDHAAGGAHPVVAPAVVELGRDEEGAGLVQRGVAGVEVGAQAVVGAEREALRVARPLDAELARVAAGGVGPEPVAADAVVVEALDDVAERDAVRGAAVALQPGAFVDHPRAGRVGLGHLRGDALQVDEGGEGLAAAGALLALRAGAGPRGSRRRAARRGSGDRGRGAARGARGSARRSGRGRRRGRGRCRRRRPRRAPRAGGGAWSAGYRRARVTDPGAPCRSASLSIDIRVLQKILGRGNWALATQCRHPTRFRGVWEVGGPRCPACAGWDG